MELEVAGSYVRTRRGGFQQGESNLGGAFFAFCLGRVFLRACSPFISIHVVTDSFHQFYYVIGITTYIIPAIIKFLFTGFKFHELLVNIIVPHFL